MRATPAVEQPSRGPYDARRDGDHPSKTSPSSDRAPRTSCHRFAIAAFRTPRLVQSPMDRLPLRVRIWLHERPAVRTRPLQTNNGRSRHTRKPHRPTRDIEGSTGRVPLPPSSRRLLRRRRDLSTDPGMGHVDRAPPDLPAAPKSATDRARSKRSACVAESLVPNPSRCSSCRSILRIPSSRFRPHAPLRRLRPARRTARRACPGGRRSG